MLIQSFFHSSRRLGSGLEVEGHELYRGLSCVEDAFPQNPQDKRTLEVVVLQAFNFNIHNLFTLYLVDCSCVNF